MPAIDPRYVKATGPGGPLNSLTPDQIAALLLLLSQAGTEPLTMTDGTIITMDSGEILYGRNP